MKVDKRCACVDPAKCKHSFEYDFTLHGDRFHKSTRTANRQLAERIADRAKNAALEQKAGIAKPIVYCRLSVLIKDYTALCEEQHATSNKDVRVLADFLASVGDRPINEVTAFAIDKWRLKRAKQVAQSTVDREMNVIRGLFTQAIAWKKIAVSPAVDVNNFSPDDTRIRVLSSEEIAIVLGAPAELALLFRVTLECLIRLSEVLGLKKEHIGRGAPSIEVLRKGGAVDRIAITPGLRDDLLAHCHKSGWVFGEAPLGKPPTQAATSVRVSRWMEGKLVDVSHHTMRHTGITVMLEAGVNPRVIQKLAGWTSLRMLERYGHVRDAEMVRAVAATRAHIDQAMAAPAAAAASR